MDTQKIVSIALEDDAAVDAGSVDFPGGHWIYSEIDGETYGVRTDSYGNKDVTKFEDWEDAEGHRQEIDASETRWLLGDEEDADDEDFVWTEVED